MKRALATLLGVWLGVFVASPAIAYDDWDEYGSYDDYDGDEFDDYFGGSYDDEYDVRITRDVAGPFYDRLAPFGIWFEHPRYGLAWRPRGVSRQWRPYWDGDWIYTRYGWTWASNEPWDVTYHYGRWINDRPYGWLWVPGRVWGPAWVDWRYGDDWIGWAPLPPSAYWRRGAFYGDYSIEPHHYCFVETRHFAAPGLRNHIVPPERSVTVIKHARPVTKYVVVNDRVVNRAIHPRLIERLGRKVKPVALREVRGAHPRVRVGNDRPRETRGIESRRTDEPAVERAPHRFDRDTTTVRSEPKPKVDWQARPREAERELGVPVEKRDLRRQEELPLPKRDASWGTRREHAPAAVIERQPKIERRVEPAAVRPSLDAAARRARREAKRAERAVVPVPNVEAPRQIEQPRTHADEGARVLQREPRAVRQENRPAQRLLGPNRLGR